VVPGSFEDIKRRVSLATVAFYRLKQNVWSRRDLSIKHKIRLYYALIVPIAVYASETWIIEEDEHVNSWFLK